MLERNTLRMGKNIAFMVLVCSPVISLAHPDILVMQPCSRTLMVVVGPFLRIPKGFRKEACFETEKKKL